MKKGKKSLVASSWWKYLLSVVIIVIYLFPIYVVVAVSLKPITDTSSRLTLPGNIYWGNYSKAFDSGGLLVAIKNTLIITVSVVIIEVILGCMAAYPLARNRSRWNKFVKNVIMGVMMVPSLSIVVGVYSTLVKMNAINTYWGIIIITATFGLPLSIYLFSNFISSIPIALDEAAAIDGASVANTFFKIILPQLKPVTVSVIIMKGVSAWNEYAYSLYILQKPQMYNITLTIKQFFAESASDVNAAAAGAVVSIIPVILIYLFLQKYFIQGAIDSALKG